MSVSISDDVYARLKEHSKKTGANVSSLVSISVSTYLDQQEMIKMMPEMLVALGKIEGEKSNLKLIDSGEN
jgi:uncharacterized protein (DUF302 family)